MLPEIAIKPAIVPNIGEIWYRKGEANHALMVRITDWPENVTEVKPEDVYVIFQAWDRAMKRIVPGTSRHYATLDHVIKNFYFTGNKV